MSLAQRPLLAIGLLVAAMAVAGLAVALPVGRALELRRAIGWPHWACAIRAV